MMTKLYSKEQQTWIFLSCSRKIKHLLGEKNKQTEVTEPTNEKYFQGEDINPLLISPSHGKSSFPSGRSCTNGSFSAAGREI